MNPLHSSKRFVRKIVVLFLCFLAFSGVFLTVANYKFSWLRKTPGKDPDPQSMYVQVSSQPQRSQMPSQPETFSEPPEQSSCVSQPESQNESSLTLVYADEFDGDELNQSVWNKVQQTAAANGELQRYQAKAVTVADGALVLTAWPDGANGGYVSGWVDTLEKLELSYGRVEIRMKLCEGKGLFPAVWLMHKSDGDGRYLEIDIMENLSEYPNTIYGVLHMEAPGEKSGHGSTNIQIEDPLEYHVYAVNWNKNGISWSIDGEEYLYLQRDISPHELYLILNLAVGGNWPGSPDDTTPFPASVYVDYIRVYSLEDAYAD